MDEIRSVFSGKVHNYYGAILLHEDNCWTKQIESINNFKIHILKEANEGNEISNFPQ